MNVENVKRKWRIGYLVCFVLFIVMLIAYIDRVNITFLIADEGFLNDFGLAERKDLQGLLTSAFLFAYGLSSLILAFVLDRLGARKGMIILAVIWAAATVMGGLSTGFVMLIVSRIILGIGEGLMVPLSSMVTKHWAPPKERGIANAIWTPGLLLGPAVGAPLMVAVVSNYDWQTSFFILAAMTVVIIIPLVLLFVHDKPSKSKFVSKEELEYIESSLRVEQENFKVNNQEDANNDLGVKTFLKNKNYWLAVFSYTTLGWMWWGILSWLPSYLTQSRGFSWGDLGVVSTLPYLAGAAAIIIGGFLVVKNIVRPGIFLWFGKLLYVICLALAIVSESNMASAMWIVGAMSGIGFAFAPEVTVLQQLLPSRYTALATGIWSGVNQMSSAFVPYLIGIIITVMGGSFTGGMLFLVGVALIGTIISFILDFNINKETKRKALAAQTTPTSSI